MVAFEHYSMYQPEFVLDRDEIKQEPFEMAYTTFNSLPMMNNVFGNPYDFKYEMERSTSQSSHYQVYADAAPSLLSSNSVPSLPSAASSTIGSPHSGYAQPVSNGFLYSHQFGAQPAIMCDDGYSYGYQAAHFDHEAFAEQKFAIGEYSADSWSNSRLTVASDPVMISGKQSPYQGSPFESYTTSSRPRNSPAASPAPSSYSHHSFSAPITIDNYSGSRANSMRRQSITSLRSAGSPQSSCSDEEGKGRCPYPDCGKVMKDLKAHMMTHEQVRPEKCPIPSCEYSRKGFARKYDKNRHTLTHYRGTMICGFCPGSGTAAEKSFNRADVFKRHLTLVHSVEQNPPNARKRSPSKPVLDLSSYCHDATGKCSTCGTSFNNAQELYEHLDDCVLKVVQQEDPTEAVNAQRLGEVTDDQDVQATFERNHIKKEDSASIVDEDEEDEDDEDEEDDTELNSRSGRGLIKTAKITSNRPIIGGNVSKKTSKRGLTWSRGGGEIIGKSRKRRKFYPPSWGMATDKMNMKKRVLCVYDGQRRLLKDDIMMHNEFEVRMPLTDGGYVTDLDLETMKRAEAFHQMDEASKGPWIQDQDFLQDFLE